MDLALTINGWIDEEVIFAQQLGSRQVFALVDRSSLEWDARSLARLANRISKAGLILAGLHASEAPRGAGGQEDADLWVANLAREATTAGIGFLSCSKVLFTKRQTVQSTLAALEAAQTGVKLALPLAVLSGKIRLSGKNRLSGEITPSGEITRSNPPSLAGVLHSLPPSAGLDVPPDMLLRLLQDAAPDAGECQAVMERLCLVSFELAAGAGPFLEANREGFDNLLSACLRLRRGGYPDLIRLGRLPGWKGDSSDAHQARAYTTGYLRGVLQAIQSGGE